MAINCVAKADMENKSKAIEDTLMTDQGDTVFKLIGNAKNAPGVAGVTLCCFAADQVPNGTPLFLQTTLIGDTDVKASDNATPNIPDVPTTKQVASVCLSIRHNFGLLQRYEREVMVGKAKNWWAAIAKEINSPSNHPVAAAAAVGIAGDVGLSDDARDSLVQIKGILDELALLGRDAGMADSARLKHALDRVRHADMLVRLMLDKDV